MIEDYFQLIVCTCPDEATAQLIAEQLVDKHQAACVSILPGVTSVYRWQGAVESTQEHMLFVKTTTEHYNKLEATILELHPYELPEIIAVPIADGLAGYLSWIDDSLGNQAIG